MSELRLAAVDGERTFPVDFNPILAALGGMIDAIEQGDLSIDKLIIVTQTEGAVDYAVAGHVTLAEGVGLLTLASRAMERDVRAR